MEALKSVSQLKNPFFLDPGFKSFGIYQDNIHYPHHQNLKHIDKQRGFSENLKKIGPAFNPQ